VIRGRVVSWIGDVDRVVVEVEGDVVVEGGEEETYFFLTGHTLARNTVSDSSTRLVGP
jgi:hypothetical protein